MKSKKQNMVRSLTSGERSEIFNQVVTGRPIKEIAVAFSVKYASIRHVVFAEWRAFYPKHFAEFGFPMTLSALRNNPPKKPDAKTKGRRKKEAA